MGFFKKSEKPLELKAYPFEHLYYNSLLDDNVPIVEDYITKNSDFDIDSTENMVKESIFLTRNEMSDGGVAICINYPEGFHSETIFGKCKDSTIEDELKFSQVMKYHSYVKEGESRFQVDVAMLRLPYTMRDDDIRRILAADRLRLYKQIICDKYNEIIDNFDKRIIVESKPIDEFNKDEFIIRD